MTASPTPSRAGRAGGVTALAVATFVAGCALPAPTARHTSGECVPSFLPQVDLGLLEYAPIDEASGLAANRRSPGVFWTHNDSGDENRIFALNEAGEHLGIYTIAGAANRDWEDMATGPGPDPGRSYIYIGEIGDNDATYDLKYIYRVREPAVDPARGPIDTTLSDVETIAFRYPDGRRDAETLMVDPWTRDLYVISKREADVRVYRDPFPQSSGGAVDTLEHVATLSLTLVTAGDISPDGREIVIKTYQQVFHWCREDGMTVADAMAAAPTLLPYTPEPQGEAIAWGADGMDYFTTSEERGGVPAHLFRYPRVIEDGAADLLRPGAHGSARRGQGHDRPFSSSVEVVVETDGGQIVSLGREVGGGLPRPGRVCDGEADAVRRADGEVLHHEDLELQL